LPKTYFFMSFCRSWSCFHSEFRTRSAMLSLYLYETWIYNHFKTMTTADQVYCRLWAQWAFNNISILNLISSVFQIFLLLNLFFKNILIKNFF
jgi:hypothetical protein